MTPELHQFRLSHFNEKARWALDFKGVPHVRRSYLPGPHMLPVTHLIMRRDMQIDADGAARGRDRAREALDLIARTAGTDGYLVGEQFSVADLTAAALLSPTVFPPECPAGVPEPRAPGLRTWLARWADHPAIAWINR